MPVSVECCGETWEPLVFASALKRLEEAGVLRLLEEASRQSDAVKRWELLKEAIRKAMALGGKAWELFQAMVPRDSVSAAALAAALEAAMEAGALGTGGASASEIAREAIELGYGTPLLVKLAETGGVTASPSDAECILRAAGLLGG